MRRQISCDAALWRGCVVRTTSSATALSFSPMARNCAAVRSASASGVRFSRAAVKPVETGEGVGSDALIGMADMRRPVGVGNGGGDVIACFFGHEIGGLEL